MSLGGRATGGGGCSDGVLREGKKASCLGLSTKVVGDELMGMGVVVAVVSQRAQPAYSNRNSPFIL